MDDDELRELTHEVAQETMKALENVFISLFLEMYDARYHFAAEAVKEVRTKSDYAFRGNRLTGTPLFELDSDHEENQNQKQES